MNKVICIKDYEGTGYLKTDTNKSKDVSIKKGDEIEWDDHGYLWFNDVCFGHMDAYPGRYFQF